MVKRNIILDMVDEDEQDEMIQAGAQKMVIRQNIARVRLATKVRKEIKALYYRYHTLTRVVQGVTRKDIKHHDMKRAVDAIHYLGGGYPYENSKGRMETMLDNFAGMYRILDFIGKGDLVVDHLKTLGIKVSLESGGKIKNKSFDEEVIRDLAKTYRVTGVTDLRGLIEKVIDICDDLQTQICKKADVERYEIRPKVKEEMGIEDPEYKRLKDVVTLRQAGPVKQSRSIPAKLKTVNTSFQGFSSATEELKTMTHLPEPRE